MNEDKEIVALVFFGVIYPKLLILSRKPEEAGSVKWNGNEG